ncbi:hypothetical protein BJY00DRAFT_314872 [Aspergillus carlsbadensis]|nr:hypothetical protein BJY00DRAFT_314872 [Aspergillus carlsbadensis]
MVAGFITAFVRPHCVIVESLQIHKNTREDVLWLNSEQPWRRSALWLLIRVVLQLGFRRLCPSAETSHDIYKHFMVYYMSMILNACASELSDEHRYIMTAKIARRLRKLDLTLCPGWLQYVQQTMRMANDTIKESWRDVIAQNNPQNYLASLARLDFEKDVDCCLPDLEKWLDGIKKRQQLLDSASFQPVSKLANFQSTELPSHFDTGASGYEVYNLAAFEDWVGTNLDAWLKAHLTGVDTCQQLSSLMTRYHAAASSLYSRNPEGWSVMLLTILEVWIACDKAAIYHHPMLEDYNAYVQMGEFESLVLPCRSQLERLARAEDYMKQRHKSLRYPELNIFRHYGTPSCFSVRVFDQSTEHQTLLATIEGRATRDRTAKREELQRKRQKYESKNCQKCRFQRQAESITIDIHEWPLPAKQPKAKATVFELKLPRSFGYWRDTTMFFLTNVLHCEYFGKDTPRADYRPNTYCGLSPYFVSVKAPQRLCLLSQVKPHERTHRKKKLIIHVTEEDVCLENGMQLQYFDDSSNCFVSSLKTPTTASTATSCAYKVPQRCSALQQFLLRPACSKDGPAPNTVIAMQDACPFNMSLEEYKASQGHGHGICIAWMNSSCCQVSTRCSHNNAYLDMAHQLVTLACITHPPNRILVVCRELDTGKELW